MNDELARVRRWLEEATADRDRMLARHAEMEEDLKEKARWAGELDAALKKAEARVVELQELVAIDQARAQETITELEAALRSAQVEAQETITRLEGTVVERTEWARTLGGQVEVLRGEVRDLEARAEELTSVLAMVRESRWVKAGRVVGLGPRLD